jgi:hypothetical protein
MLDQSYSLPPIKSFCQIFAASKKQDRSKIARQSSSILANKPNHSSQNPSIQPASMPTLNLPIELWEKILVLLDSQEAIAVSKAHPRFFGALIESNRLIRFRNALNLKI